MATPDEPMTFWDHLEALRGVILRILAVAVAGFIVAFCLKEPLFRLILAPASPDFILYRWITAVAGSMGFDASALCDFNVELFSTTLTAQFMIHMKMAFYVSLVVIMPYTLYLLFGFVSPALHRDERRSSTKVVIWSYILFMVGIILDYLVIFPLAFRFLGTYQVNNSVANMLTISSYVDTLLMLSLMMGVVFELPVLSWLLAKFGLLRKEWMARYRRHAFVIILIIAAVITPTADIFTLLIVSLPIWLLYECSIFVVGRVQKNK